MKGDTIALSGSLEKILLPRHPFIKTIKSFTNISTLPFEIIAGTSPTEVKGDVRSPFSKSHFFYFREITVVFTT